MIHRTGVAVFVFALSRALLAAAPVAHGASKDNGHAQPSGASVAKMLQRLDADDPYPRSNRRLVSLRDLPSAQTTRTMGGNASAYALPIIGGNTTHAVVLYGEHASGEPVDAEEERLLSRLAHGTANSYEHLLLRQRDREIAELRVLSGIASGVGPAKI
jgi:hypothetical protein